MITGSIATGGRVIPSDPRVACVLSWLAKLETTISPGSYFLCEKVCRAVVSETETSPADQKPYEAHRRYLDIHYELSGSEAVEYAPIDQLTEVKAYSEETDSLLLQGEVMPRRVVLRAGEFCILFPEEAHKPCCASEAHPLKKVVVKVPVEWISPDARMELKEG